MKNYQNIYMRRGQRVAHLSTDQLPKLVVVPVFVVIAVLRWRRRFIFVRRKAKAKCNSLAGVGGGRKAAVRVG